MTKRRSSRRLIRGNQSPGHSDLRSYRAPSLTTNGYCSIPQRLITDIYDSPLAIGLYGLIARLWLITHAPVPLSRADVLRYDPSLKAGAVKRAFDRLVAGGWLVETPQADRKKHHYTPTWGRVCGTALPWQLDQPCHGRPRHISRLPVDRSLFDICMGKLAPHATLRATIIRYVTIPVLSLADIGCYALTLADIPHETPALKWLNVVRNGQALRLPSEEQLLARIYDSTGQRTSELTISGMRRLGIASIAPESDANDCSDPLFFVPPGLIGPLIGPLIGSLIGSSAANDRPPTAIPSAESRSDAPATEITWESNTRDSQSPPAPPHTDQGRQWRWWSKSQRAQRAKAGACHEPTYSINVAPNSDRDSGYRNNTAPENHQRSA